MHASVHQKPSMLGVSREHAGLKHPASNNLQDGSGLYFTAQSC